MVLGTLSSPRRVVKGPAALAKGSWAGVCDGSRSPGPDEGAAAGRLPVLGVVRVAGVLGLGGRAVPAPAPAPAPAVEGRTRRRAGRGRLVGAAGTPEALRRLGWPGCARRAGPGRGGARGLGVRAAGRARPEARGGGARPRARREAFPANPRARS